MGTFNVDAFSAAAGGGADPVTSFGVAFGVPSCMLGLASAALALLPTPALVLMQQRLLEAKAAAEDQIASLYRSLFQALGIEEDEFGGFKSIFGDESAVALALANLSAAIGYINAFYEEYQDIVDNIEAIVACFNQFDKLEKNQNENVSTGTTTFPSETALESIRQRANPLADFVQDTVRQVRLINEILADRRINPDLEPCFPASAEFDELFEGTTLRRCPEEDPGLVEKEEIFRLTYGPPVSVDGKYILTADGLYYDSQSGGLEPVFLSISGMVPPGDKWKYDYDPNLGGKGDQISIQSLNKFTDNIFDISRVDDSKGLSKFYEADHFLAVLRQQRDKHIYDLSSELSQFEQSEGENSPIVQNQRQVILAEIANHNNKIDRRKKQIEVAVKVPTMYGDEDLVFLPGQIPINDFSFLEKYNINVDLELQKKLVFSQAEVNGIVLPLTPKFVKSSYKAPSVGFAHLEVPNVGKGSIIYTPSGQGSGTLLSLNDQIVSEGLFAIYNFLDSRLELPSSMNFNLTNCATSNRYNDAQFVGTNPQNVFFSGLAIPYLEGIVKNKSSFPAGASALGSFIKLPDTKEFRELTYNRDGFSLECWVHVPNITDEEQGWLGSTTSSLTKVLLGCENTGIASGVTNLAYTGEEKDLDFLDNDKSTNFVRGMLLGFTRDRRITQENTGYSNVNADNDPDLTSLFLAPTISKDFSSLSWVNKDDCAEVEDFYKMKVQINSNSTLQKIDSEFVLLDICVNPRKDIITFYADGELLVTSSISETFGVKPTEAFNLPSFKKPNSFEYDSSSTDGPLTVQNGPYNNTYYTPWIVGGGWTDGMYKYGNFMGGDRGGIVSGLRGHIGSLKFYSKPLNSNEVLKNYNAQKGLFKNIKV